MLLEAKSNVELGKGDGDENMLVLAKREFEKLRNQYEMILALEEETEARTGYDT